MNQRETWTHGNMSRVRGKRKHYQKRPAVINYNNVIHCGTFLLSCSWNSTAFIIIIIIIIIIK